MAYTSVASYPEKLKIYTFKTYSYWSVRLLKIAGVQQLAMELITDSRTPRTIDALVPSLKMLSKSAKSEHTSQLRSEKTKLPRNYIFQLKFT